MALRSSGIDARTYLCRAPLDRIDGLNVERTRTRGSKFLNNAHVLYRKCLFIYHALLSIYILRTYLNQYSSLE